MCAIQVLCREWTKHNPCNCYTVILLGHLTDAVYVASYTITEVIPHMSAIAFVKFLFSILLESLIDYVFAK